MSYKKIVEELRKKGLINKYEDIDLERAWERLKVLNNLTDDNDNKTLFNKYYRMAFDTAKDFCDNNNTILTISVVDDFFNLYYKEFLESNNKNYYEIIKDFLMEKHSVEECEALLREVEDYIYLIEHRVEELSKELYDVQRKTKV